jgi:hypothetical protein
MVVIPSTGALRYHNLCKDGGTSPEYFGYTAEYVHINTFVLTFSTESWLFRPNGRGGI